MELALLREENARLKVERHRAPDSGRIIERMRHLGEASRDEPRVRTARRPARPRRRLSSAWRSVMRSWRPVTRSSRRCRGYASGSAGSRPKDSVRRPVIEPELGSSRRTPTSTCSWLWAQPRLRTLSRPRLEQTSASSFNAGDVCDYARMRGRRERRVERAGRRQRGAWWPRTSARSSLCVFGRARRQARSRAHRRSRAERKVGRPAY